MNKNQAKGEAKDIAGKVQEESGKLVGSNDQIAKGVSKQIAGKAQKTVGNAQQAIKNHHKV
jgi:uncharacterized protein YjbJ (UPF0337 family)